MKRVLLLGILISLVFMTNAQTIPNAGFENWDSTSMYENPTGYSTSNTYTYPQIQASNVLKQSPAYSGNYAVRLQTINLGGSNFMGFMINGDATALLSGGGLQSIKGGFPYSSLQFPDTFMFYARYQCVQGDSAYAVVILKRSGIPISYKILKLYGIENTYQKYSFVLARPGGLPIPPDSVIIAFTSSNPMNQGVSSDSNWVEVDKISFRSSSGTVIPIQNGNFENWDVIAEVEPQNWVTLNTYDMYMGQPPSVVPVTPGHSGNFAAKITSNVLNIGNPVPDTFGILLLGNQNNNTPGMGLVNNPDSLSFWYKYNNSKNTKDSAYAEIAFFKFNSISGQSDQIDSNGFALSAASAFTYKTLRFPYIYGKSPDTIAIFFSSSKFTPTGRGIGNYLIIDDVVLWSHFVGIPVSSNDQVNSFVYPNPAVDYTNVQFELNEPADVTISLVDLNGRNIKSQNYSLSKGKQVVKLDLQEVIDGQYLVVIGQGSNSIYSKRIVVKR